MKMTTEEKNNLISYLKKYKKLDKDICILGMLILLFIITNLIFLVSNQTIWALGNFILVIILCAIVFVINHNNNKIAKSIILLLKDYKVITINENITELYDKETIIKAAKHNKTINLRTNYETSISEELNAENTSAIELLKKYPDLNSIKKVNITYTINELILDYQKDILEICRNNIPKTYIEYKINEPLRKAELKKKKE